MEEESWASCGNRDYLTPWDLSSLSTKSSPMLSMMLGVEGEDGPSWNSWSPSLMCMNIIFNVSSPLLPQFPSTSSSTKSWSQSLLHIVVACKVLNSWECFFMPAKHFKHTLPPGWRSGVETNANKPTIPKISICGIASLAKLVSVRVC